MGPVRHRHLINLLLVVVALDLAVALGAVYARGGGVTPGAAKDGSVVATGKLRERRGHSTSARSVETTTESAPAPAPSTTAATAPRPTTTTTARGTTAATARRSRAAATATTPGRDGPGGLADPVGDTFVARTNAPLAESRADILRAGAAYAPGGITFILQVNQRADPRHDARWADNNTYAVWIVDTNGDTRTDYEIRYYVIDEDNLGAEVTRPGEAGESLCDPPATYRADGYKVTVDPACLGNPTSFTYRATMHYGTNPADRNAKVASDVVPNKGWSSAVRNNG